mmetsp:Transcript_33005/g.60493  ORF Transcript_33005/g.60493 Transcript_33005/m.60493 type:complete len:189 (+) Transcript_33005:65-631(+)
MLTPSRLLAFQLLVSIRCSIGSVAVSSVEQEFPRVAGHCLLQQTQKLDKAESVPTLHYEHGRDNSTHWHLTVSAVRNGDSVNSSTQVLGTPEISENDGLSSVVGPLLMSKGFNVTYTVMQTFWHGYDDPDASWNAPDPFADRGWWWHFRWLCWSLEIAALLVFCYYTAKLFYYVLSLMSGAGTYKESW